MPRRLAVLLPALVLTACFDKADEDEDDAGDSGGDEDTSWPDDEPDETGPDEPDEPDTIETTEPSLGVECVWEGDEALVVEVFGGEGPYRLGLREGSDSTDPWTGEDCMDGYLGPDGTLYRYCHRLGPAGGILENVVSIDDLVEGETTLFWPGLDITYMLLSAEAGTCWTWGVEPRVYADAMGCEILPLDCR